MPVGTSTTFVPTQVRRVTNLNPSGAGSFHDAITTPANGAGVAVIFDGLTGSINRVGQNDTILAENGTTIIGESAAGPITMIGSTLRVKASNISISNMRFLAGNESGAPSYENRDSLGIEGNTVPRDILIDHCTFGWSLDGLLDIWPGPSGVSPKNITIRESIFAEALKDTGLHPSGPHSTAMVMGDGTADVLIYRCLFAHNDWRQPAVCAGSNVAIVNNVFYNPIGLISFFPPQAGWTGAGTKVAAIGNHAIMGPNSPWYWPAPQFEYIQGSAPYTGSTLYRSDNKTSVHADLVAAHSQYSSMDGFPGATPKTTAGFYAATINVTLPAGLSILPKDSVLTSVLGSVGPVQKTVFENRIIAEVTDGRIGTIRDVPIQSEKEYFGFPAVLNLKVPFKGNN